MTVRALFRPIDEWPGVLRTDEARSWSRFRSEWYQLLNDLEHEVSHIDRYASDPIIQIAADASAMRNDGGVRANAKPRHPGVIVSFETKELGPLRWACDRYKGNGYNGYLVGWQANLRAIVLTLEALRAVKRYGAASDAETYRGWQQLPMTTAGVPITTTEEAFRVLHGAAGSPPGHSSWKELYRLAVKNTHPDTGGLAEMFRRVQEAWDFLRATGLA